MSSKKLTYQLNPNTYYAKVLLDKRNNLILTYKIGKKHLEEKSIKQGIKVKVPLKNHLKVGTVLEVYQSDKKFKYPIKEIHSIDNENVLIEDKLFLLISWIAKYYNEPEEFVMKAFLPFNENKIHKSSYKVDSAKLMDGYSLDKYNEIKKSAPKQAEIYKKFESSNNNKIIPIKLLGGRTDALKRLIDKKILKLDSVVWEDENQELKIFEQINDNSSNLDLYEPENKDKIAKTKSHTLTKEQQNAFDFAKKSFSLNLQNKRVKPILLHGVTGSGKTEIFIRLIEEVLKSGKSILYLTPEIQLAIEVKKYLLARLPEENIVIIHSQVASGRKMRDWKRIKDGICRIVLGTRSALFAPLKDLGLIIVDEEHEGAYKQEFSPRYSARDAAIVRANIEKSLIILGSATPSLESYKNSIDKKYDYIALKKRIDSVILPDVHIINMLREEVYKDQRSKIFSKKLIQAIFDRLKLKEQVILFINRRGFASFMQCQSCGESITCVNCSTSLRYHKAKKKLICHFCGFTLSMENKCSSCGSDDMIYVGFGTEKICEMLNKFFKHAKIDRVDTDLSEKDRTKCIDNFGKGKIDILVGTQMIAKGFHFPRVTLVGIINADQGMNMPDFRSSEKTFQILTQVSGRSGRGDSEGEVFVQTSCPHNSIIQFSKNHNFIDFAEEELEMRKQFNFAPFFRVSVIRCYSEVESLGVKFFENFSQEIKNIFEKKYSGKVIISDPLPSPIERIEKRFRFQTMIRSMSNKIVVETFNEIKNRTKIPQNIKIFLDVDAVQFM